MRFLLGVCALGCAALGVTAGQEPTGEDIFDRRVRPVLEKTCLKCHNPNTKKAGLDLSRREALVAGGDGGPAIVAGQGRKSLLYRVAAHLQEPFMPHRAPRLAEEDVEAVRRWVDLGAPYTAVLEGSSPKGLPEPHWAFQPLRRPAPPAVRDTAAKNPIDRFVLSALESKGIAPNPPAERATLIRRACFDLVGLPPDPDEVDAFVGDPSPEAYSRLVDRLLASPRYGERWGRHWLDLARYADSGGFENDFDRVWAYPYRDFVIRALNEDLPFDAFVRWQIAGDVLEPDRPDAVAATGFLAAGPRVWVLVTDSEENRERYRYDHLDDVLSTLGSAILGLTVGCARCHDHKYDPISRREYYRMLATFQGMRITDRALPTPLRKLEDWLQPRQEAMRLERIAALKVSETDKEFLRRELDRISGRQKKLHQTYGPKVDVSVQDVAARLSPAERTTLETLQAEAAGLKGEVPRVLAVRDVPGDPPKSYLLEGGDPGRKKEEVTPGFLDVLTRGQDPARAVHPRAALAAWMTDPERGAGGLLARVIVNRLWHHHFGEGLVRTTGDFGTQGDLPAHRELLDWLAAELVDQGWKLKPLHRLLMTSAVYVQSCGSDPRRSALDPENRFWWRRRPVRVEAETMRDAVLSVSGRLDPRMYGPSVRVPIPAGAIATRSHDPYKADLKDGPETWRRSVYVFRKRSVPVPFFETFDAPSPSASCGRRTCSTVAPQALALLNDPVLRACAEDFARRVRKEAGGDPAAQTEQAFRLALGRRPTSFERQAAMTFLGSGGREKLADLGQTLFCLSEFLYVD